MFIRTTLTLTGDGSGVWESLLEPVLPFLVVPGSSVFLRPSPLSSGDSLGVRCCAGRGGEDCGDFFPTPGDLLVGPELSGALTDGMGYGRAVGTVQQWVPGRNTSHT